MDGRRLSTRGPRAGAQARRRATSVMVRVVAVFVGVARCAAMRALRPLAVLTDRNVYSVRC